MQINQQTPTQAFVFASWAALFLGIFAYLIGLWNAEIDLSDRGYHLTLVFYGLFSVISLQKSVRDRHENIPVTDIYYGLSWASTLIAITLLAVGLWNAELWLSEKGFYAMAYALSLFGAVAVQKNTRDVAASRRDNTEGRGRRTKFTGETTASKKGEAASEEKSGASSRMAA